MSNLFEETDPCMMHHWVDRIDAGIDSPRRAELCEWLHKFIDRLEDAETERDALAEALALAVCHVRDRDPSRPLMVSALSRHRARLAPAPGEAPR